MSPLHRLSVGGIALVGAAVGAALTADGAGLPFVGWFLFYLAAQAPPLLVLEFWGRKGRSRASCNPA